MSDVVDDVARSISLRTGSPQQTHPRWEFLHPDEQNAWRRKAELAIAAATPHIRAALFDELLSYTDSLKGTLPPLPLALATKIIKEYARKAQG